MCEVFGESFKNGKKFKCEECNFIGMSEDSMQIHVGRKHCEQYECGLCQHENKTREDLETHLKTCEIYICSRCELRETTLAKIKEHMQEICEATPYTVLSHRKLHRDDPDEVSHRQYFFRDV